MPWVKLTGSDAVDMDGRKRLVGERAYLSPFQSSWFVARGLATFVHREDAERHAEAAKGRHDAKRS